MTTGRESLSADRGESKLPCGCYAEMNADGYLWITASAFLCESRHSQGDLVEVREGMTRVPGRCHRCKGTGVVPAPGPDRFVTCPVCDGSGK